MQFVIIKKLHLIYISVLIVCLTLSGNVLAQLQNQKKHVAASVSNYELTFSESDPAIVKVKASLRVSKNKIRMLSYGHPWLKHGWATFVSDLQVIDKNGESLTTSLIEENGWGAWRIEVPDGTEVDLSYTVNLEHAKHDWNQAGGQDSRPEWKNGAFFAISRAFFIYSFVDSQYIVSLKFPTNWELVSPWQSVPNITNSFYVKSKESLVSNLFILGAFETRELKFEGMTIQIAIDKRLSQYGSKLESMLQKQLEYYSTIFGGVPNINFVVGVSAANEDDGEAYFNSFNQVIKEKTISKDDSNVIWANTLGHEMFHFWNGTFVLRTDKKPQLYWFIEGFTEYYASFTLHKQKKISTGDYLKKLEKYLARYFITSNMWSEKRLSLKEAGDEKHKNWLRIYGGGSTIALALDIDIYTKSNGKQSLNSLMQALKNKYGAEDRYFYNDSILETLNELTGHSYDMFFDNYILSPKGYLEIAPYLEKVGIDVLQKGDEFYLSVKDGVKFNQFIERSAF